jgi:hypothetical protein
MALNVYYPFLHVQFQILSLGVHMVPLGRAVFRGGGFTGSNPPKFWKKIFGLTKENKYMHFNFISNTAVV